ncbi:ubiquitin-conjugating enzyme domain-containing protein [Ditylenchus destructor]|uniref:Ubiquitin-conjugating enzyme domain-containing protein n=1 Tax=Ditylenchus destructor TaxID=166010 RepID=A0AAD4QZ62_9BILA|nr:ubiquitin-conjugating enzyme domain-containing protein [Ditylenchus destructor]
MSNSMPTTELNMRCAGVKRLMKEAVELRTPTELFCARPMEDNLFEWHFTVRGPPDTVYENGVYHGRIILPPEYPMKPPNLILLTPNGRFETNKKICLSISGYHPETWLPSWSIRTALLALVGFMPTHSAGALGGLECSAEERKRLALKSQDWRCEACSCVMRDVLPPIGSSPSAVMDELESARQHNKVPAASASGDKSSAQEPASNAVDQTSNDSNKESPPQKNEGQTPAQEPSETSRAVPITPPAQSPAKPARSGNRADVISRSGWTLMDVLTSPLMWILILAVAFFALLYRRMFLNLPA